MSFDELHNRTYDAKEYNCAHFVCELFLKETGIDITSAMLGFLTSFSDRKIPTGLAHFFQPLRAPEEHCIVLMRRKNAPPHVGLYLRKRIAQITLDGVSWLPSEIACSNYTNVRFYKCLKS